MTEGKFSLGDGARVVVVGASGGIGNALVRQLAAQDQVAAVYACSRTEVAFDSAKVTHLYLDLADEETMKAAANAMPDQLDLVIVATGMLSDAQHLPEKAIKDFDLAAMQRCFTINTIGPALVAKWLLPKLPRHQRAIFAALSARVGSITDNQLGGWYSYRASKAALNMIIKTAAIESKRNNSAAIIVGLHPGTVDTDLSKPFQRRVKHAIFSPDQAAEQLLTVIHQLKAADSGKHFAWDGEEIAP